MTQKMCRVSKGFFRAMAQAKGGDAADLPLLDCSSAGESPLTAGMLARLLAGEDPLPRTFSGAVVWLCGQATVPSSSFSSRTHLLLLLQSLNSLESLTASDTTSAERVREEVERCVEWLHSLEVYCHRFIISWLAVEREALRAEAERLLGWLKLTVNHLEPLQHLLLSSGDQSSCDCHLIRLSLHIHWTAVSVSFRLAPVTGWRWFLGQARLSLSCLLSHAASLSLLSPGLPGCACLRELWLLLRHTLDLSPNTSFWAVVSSLLCETITPSQPHTSDETVVLSPSDPVVFGWWCVGHLALLYCSSEEGREVEGRGLVPHWDLVHHLLPLTFRQGASEPQLRTALKVCVSLTGLWAPPSTLPCLSAWDFYHKHMDDLFLTETATISGWASPEGSSPSHWLQHLQSLWYSTNPVTTETNGFQLFLRLICVTMATSGEEGKLWRLLKGRFYSKLHRRWLSGRKGAGLQRVLSLLLTLAWAGDCQEVTTRTVSLLSQSGLTEAVETSHILWRAVFAMMLLLLGKRETLDDLVTKLKPALTSIVKPHPPESCTSQWKAVSVILEGTVQVVEAGLDLGAGNLIGDHISDLLTSTEGGHLNRVLRMVESLCSILSSLPVHSSAGQLLWHHCSKPLLSLSHLPLHPSLLPSTLAALTEVTSHQSLTLSLSLFQEVTGDSISPLLASAYLGHVIENDVIRHHVLSTGESQLHTIHVWFRCVAELDHTPSATPTSRVSSLQQLTNQLTKLPIVSVLLGNQATPTDPMTVLKLLLGAMETSYTDQEGVEWRDRLRVVLGEMTHYLEPSVTGARGPAAIRHAYQVAGLVVSSAPRLTYSRTDSRCLLPRLLDWLVLPLTSSHRPQPQGAAAAIKTSLHLFLLGLLKLEPVRDDFVRRKVKQVFSRYFHECCQPHSLLISPSQNPFLLALRPWFGTSYHGNGEELWLVMEVVASQSLSLPLQPTSLFPTTRFIKNVVERVQSPSLMVAMMVPLIGHMTSCLLTCDMCPSDREAPVIRCMVVDTLNLLFTAHRDHQHLLPWSSLLAPLTSLISRHSGSVDPALLARPLRMLGNMYPDLLQQLIPHLAEEEDLQTLRAHLI